MLRQEQAWGSKGFRAATFLSSTGRVNLLVISAKWEGAHDPHSNKGRLICTRDPSHDGPTAFEALWLILQFLAFAFLQEAATQLAVDEQCAAPASCKLSVRAMDPF